MQKQRKYRECVLCCRKQRTTNEAYRFVCRICAGVRRRALSKLKGEEKFPNDVLGVDIEVLLGLEEEDLPIKKLSERVKLPISSTHKSIKRLIQWGFVEKRDMLACTTDRSKRVFLNLKGWDLKRLFVRNRQGTGKGLRFHALQGKFNVSKPIQNYEYYLGKYLTFTVGRSKKKKGMRLELAHSKVIVYNDSSIAVTFPDILVPVVNENAVGMGYCRQGWAVDNLAEQLMKTFRGLEIDWFVPFTSSGIEIGIENSTYARKYREMHGRFFENERIKTDKSHGNDELETHRSLKAGEAILDCLKLEEQAVAEESCKEYTNLETSATNRAQEQSKEKEKEEK